MGIVFMSNLIINLAARLHYKVQSLYLELDAKSEATLMQCADSQLQSVCLDPEGESFDRGSICFHRYLRCIDKQMAASDRTEIQFKGTMIDKDVSKSNVTFSPNHKQPRG